MRRNLILCLPCAQYKLEPTPEPSDEEESSSEEEEDAFGGKKKQVEDDPAASEYRGNLAVFAFVMC